MRNVVKCISEHARGEPMCTASAAKELASSSLPHGAVGLSLHFPFQLFRKHRVPPSPVVREGKQH